MPRPEERKCAVCGASFVVDLDGRSIHGKDPKQQHCSHSCSMKRERVIATKEKSCQYCGVPFKVAAGKSSQYYPPATRMFCSVQCQTKARYKSGIEVPNLTVAEAAYMAAFLDGEGSVFTMRTNKGKKIRSMRIVFYNSHAGVLEIMQSWCNGVGAFRQTHKKTGKWKAQYVWQVGSYPAAAILRQLIPYMIVKKDAANSSLAVFDELVVKRTQPLAGASGRKCHGQHQPH